MSPRRTAYFTNSGGARVRLCFVVKSSSASRSGRSDSTSLAITRGVLSSARSRSYVYSSGSSFIRRCANRSSSQTK